MTKLEKKLLKRKIGIFLLWTVGFIVLIWMYTIHWLMGVCWTLLQYPLLIGVLYFSNLYVSKYDYFKHFSKRPKAERMEFSQKCEIGSEFPRVGELVFVEEYVIFTKFGAVLPYEKIAKISHTKGYAGYTSSLQSLVYTVTFQMSSGRSYKCRIYNDDSFFKGPDSAFDRALEMYRQKRLVIF